MFKISSRIDNHDIPAISKSNCVTYRLVTNAILVRTRPIWIIVVIKAEVNCLKALFGQFVERISQITPSSEVPPH